MVISFAAYLFYAYAVIPLSYSGLLFLYSKRYQICPLIKCLGPLVKCVREPACRSVLDCLSDCDTPTSPGRRQAIQQFAHVPFPDDPALCRYQCFDQITTLTAGNFIECVGGSGCLEPAPPEYATPPIAHEISKALPFDTIQPVLAGSWKKLYTTGWDIWPCQLSEFHPPQALQPEPLAWMQDSWPTQANVWRMDLRWWASPSHNYTFHMTNNMYPGKQWDDFPISKPVGAEATLKTRAIMWGTEAHENWYLLDYNRTMQTILVYYVAYTMAVQKIDSITMVLRRDDSSLGPFTNEMAMTVEQRALSILGDKFGRLYRIEPCLL